jgi:hypothetical protein
VEGVQKSQKCDDVIYEWSLRDPLAVAQGDTSNIPDFETNLLDLIFYPRSNGVAF